MYINLLEIIPLFSVGLRYKTTACGRIFTPRRRIVRMHSLYGEFSESKSIENIRSLEKNTHFQSLFPNGNC